MYILLVLSVVVSLIGGVPRMGPRVPFALLPFGQSNKVFKKHVRECLVGLEIS